ELSREKPGAWQIKHGLLLYFSLNGESSTHHLICYHNDKYEEVMLAKVFRRDKQTTDTMQLIGPQGEERVQQLEQGLSSVDGVSEVAVSLDDEKLKITYNTAQTNLPTLQSAIKSTGFEALKPVHGEDGNCCGGCT